MKMLGVIIYNIDLGYRLPFIEMLYNKMKVNVLAIGYRGYGYSEGIPTEEGLMLDGEATVNYAFTHLADEINTEDVYILGRSLGGAVGIHATNHLNPKVEFSNLD
jgi:alpha-beta hydrolase superfamily lysophospholipase